MSCGACGAPFLATGAGRWRCKGHRTGTCDNGSITTTELETRALAGIRERLLTPALIKRFAALLQQELAAAAKAGNAERTTAEHELAEIRARITKLVTRIEEDDDAPRALTTRLKELEGHERRLEETLAATPASLVVQLPANYESLYTRAIAELDAHLASDDGANGRNVVRALVEKIVVQRGSSRGGKRRPIQLHGDLYRMLDFAQAAIASNAKSPSPDGQGLSRFMWLRGQDLNL